VISKLIAIGGASEEESFEVQLKVRIEDEAPVLTALDQPDIEIIRKRHFHEFDTYFSFDDSNQGWLRYREDEFIDENNQISGVRSRLTLIGPVREENFPEQAFLSRSRYLAPATQSLRFYREYFQPSGEIEIEKHRLRFLVRYRETEFFINLDQVNKPALGYFLEIKSRTWSRQDAKLKSQLSAELLRKLSGDSGEVVTADYIEMAASFENQKGKTKKHD